MAKSEEKVYGAQKKLKKILKGAEKDGHSLKDLIQLCSASKILDKTAKNQKDTHKKFQFLIFFVGILGILINTSNIYSLQKFSAFWLKWNYGALKENPCTLSMPHELVNIFRPPVTCSICRGVTKVDKVANLSRETFEARYAYTGRPIVITDGMANWTAQHVFGFEFLKKIYTKRMEQWKLYNCQFFPYNTEFKDLSEVFNMSNDRAYLSDGAVPWYVGWSNCDDEVNQILRRHYEKPYFLPETAEIKKLDWIFMGSSGYGAPMHVDNVEHPSWQAQLRGKKKWSLQPPPECYYECENVQIVVEPGEIIDVHQCLTNNCSDQIFKSFDVKSSVLVVLDTNRWYHSTIIVSKEISITIGAEYD